MISRALTIPLNNSFFLFGARGTGKSTLLAQIFKDKDPIIIDLLRRDTYRELLAHPEKLSQLILPAKGSKKFVVIDEVQKIPELLELVHYHIEHDKILFALTGSSSRKLKRGGANLLAGRAFIFKIFPLLFSEYQQQLSLEEALRWGTLPMITNFASQEDRARYLEAYADTYLREEIIEEQILRKIPPFSRFLAVAAQGNGKLINYAKIARDINSDPSNVRNYYSILEETLVGFLLEPFHTSIRKRQRHAPKFYFFDTGIVRTLAGLLDVPLKPENYEFGNYFESFLINQIRTYLTYRGKQFKLSYLRSGDSAEVDLIIERSAQPTLFIEIKSATTINSSMLNNLKSLSSESKNSIPICLYRGTEKLEVNGISVLPWQEFFEEFLN